MARQESDREDLIREATALVERVELQLEELPEPVVVGFRRDGSCSIFWGADPVYQFTTDYNLRRAYRQGLLIKAEQGALVSLDRRRSAGQVSLVRHVLSATDAASLVDELQQHLELLQTKIVQRQVSVNGQVPAEGDVVGRVLTWLQAFPERLQIARRPNVG